MQTQQNRETISATNLFIFNPEHDLALGVGNGPYTPPAEVMKLRKELSLLPALYAGDSDFIILPEEVSPHIVRNLKYFDIAEKKKLRFVSIRDIGSIPQEITQIIPWGWDNALADRLSFYGIDTNLLPSPEQLKTIRLLSHRNTALRFRKKLASILKEPVKNPPVEIKTLDEVASYLDKNPLAYFKAPWSSSGRGIIVSDHITRKGLFEWAHGVIKKQGSLIAEPKWERVFDFASEWWISDGEPEFLGYSVFETSSRGKYHGNLSGTQEDFISIIHNKASSFNKETLDAQALAIRQLIAPFYSGPLGIDMLADQAGDLNPCVEINLRLTMGFINLLPPDFFRRKYYGKSNSPNSF